MKKDTKKKIGAVIGCCAHLEKDIPNCECKHHINGKMSLIADPKKCRDCDKPAQIHGLCKDCCPCCESGKDGECVDHIGNPCKKCGYKNNWSKRFDEKFRLDNGWYDFSLCNDEWVGETEADNIKDFIRNLLKGERNKAHEERYDISWKQGREELKQEILSMVEESIKFWHIQWEGIEDVKQRARRKEFNKEVTLLINSVLEDIKKQIENL